MSFAKLGLKSWGAAAALVVLTAAVPGPAAARPAPDSFADLAARLLPAVVNVSTIQTATAQREGGSATPRLPKFPPGSPFDEFFKNFFNHNAPGGQHEAMPDKTTSLGSGFIIDPAGYVVTNNHVIADADRITVTLHDGAVLKAKVVGHDAKTDIAVLKIDAKGPLTAVRWGDSNAARVGDWVLAIGNPFGLGGTVTAGILSARQRDINSGPYDDFLQTDASINRGNSGGPMFNMDGQVIGINTAIYSPSGGSIGIGFAIPSALAKGVVDQLIKEPDHTVHRGWLGVRVQAVTADIAESLGLKSPHGALIASVEAKSPALQAGMEPGDIVLSFDGAPVTEMRHLPLLVAEAEVGKTVPVTVWRKRRQMTLAVKIGRLPDDHVLQASARERALNKRPGDGAVIVKTLGLSLSNVTPQLKQRFSLPDDSKGAVVVAVAKGSPASEKIQAGDVIMEAAQEEVHSAAQVTGKVEDAKKSGRKSILLLVERQGDLRFVALRLDKG